MPEPRPDLAAIRERWVEPFTGAGFYDMESAYAWRAAQAEPDIRVLVARVEELEAALRHRDEVDDSLDESEREALTVLGEFTVCETEDGDVGVFPLPLTEETKSISRGDTVRDAILNAAESLRATRTALAAAQEEPR